MDALTFAEGIFEREAKRDDLGSGIQLDRTRPSLDVLLADFPQKPVQGDYILFGEEVFTISSEQPDGFGMSTLMLMLDSTRTGLETEVHPTQFGYYRHDTNQWFDNPDPIALKQTDPRMRIGLWWDFYTQISALRESPYTIVGTVSLTVQPVGVFGEGEVWFVSAWCVPKVTPEKYSAAVRPFSRLEGLPINRLATINVADIQVDHVFPITAEDRWLFFINDPDWDGTAALSVNAALNPGNRILIFVAGDPPAAISPRLRVRIGV